MKQAPTRSNGGEFKHPAFGNIAVSRVSGKADLHGSDMTSERFITITISGAKMERDLSNDWHFATNTKARVAMTEAQWATFVSSIGVGGGTPCTLQWADGEPKPKILREVTTLDLLTQEADAVVSDGKEALTDIADLLSAVRMGKGKRAELEGKLRKASEKVDSHIDYIRDQFDEYVERSKEQAKAEIHAHATMMATPRPSIARKEDQ